MKKWLEENISTLIAVIMFLIALAGIVFYIVVLCKYAGTPINELPSWVAWFLFRKE